MRSSLFGGVTQRKLVVNNWRFGTTSRCHHQGSSRPRNSPLWSLGPWRWERYAATTHPCLSIYVACHLRWANISFRNFLAFCSNSHIL